MVLSVNGPDARPRARLLPAIVILVTGTALCMVLGLAMGFVAKALQTPIDVPIYAWLQRSYVADSPWTRLNVAYTQIGDPLPMLVQAVIASLLLAVAFGRRWWLPVIALPLAMGLEWGLQKTLEWVVDRDPPPMGIGNFPSGGSARCVLIYGLMMVFVLIRWPQIGHRWRIAGAVLVAALALMEAYSRLYLLKHWPTDIPPGLILGGLLLLTMTAAIHRADPGEGGPASGVAS